MLFQFTWAAYLLNKLEEAEKTVNLQIFI